MKCGWCGKEGDEKFCNQEHADNSAVHVVLNELTDEMDITFGATTFPWKCCLTAEAYDTLKNRPGTHWDANVREYVPRNLIYEKDGHEYLRAWENHNIPFIIHMRIAEKDGEFIARNLDELNRPDVHKEYHKAWDETPL
jgi:hypothetical protein